MTIAKKLSETKKEYKGANGLKAAIFEASLFIESEQFDLCDKGRTYTFEDGSKFFSSRWDEADDKIL